MTRKPGRPRIADGKRMTVNLDAQTVARAKALGDGNISRGIRLAFVENEPEPVTAPEPDPI